MAMTPDAQPVVSVPLLRIVVACEHPLVAESVRIALAARGHDVIILRWPPDSRRVGRRGLPLTPRPDLGLLLCDLDCDARIADANKLVAGLDVSWVVLAAPGPAWGAVLLSGASAVLSTATDFATLSRLLSGELDARAVLTPERRRELVEQWFEHKARLRAVQTGVESLTTREGEVLRRLHAGDTVREISEVDQVSEATVRSQVKAVLRKLEVSSQLAAVSSYELVHRS